MPSENYSVLILGLDGATFDLMLPWIEQGDLPCLGELVRRGARSRLCSTVPPITPCAWSSLMTGKDPDQHGLFDFVEPRPGAAGFRFTNAGSRRGETLWGYLSRQGRRVGVLNVPMTYPPEPVNGYLISGLDTPHEHSPYTYPRELRRELRERGIGYQIDIQHLGNMRTNRRRDERLQALREMETIRTRALLDLSRRDPTDFTMLVYTATDQVQHHFWHYMDPAHEKYDPKGARRYAGAIHDVYVHIDRLMATVLEERGDDTVVMVVSDHGFGPTSSVRLRINQALERAGLLTFQSEGTSGRAVRSLAGLSDRVLRATLSDGAKRLIAGVLPRLRVWFEGLDEARIDWSRTRAFANEAFRTCPAVWLNHRLLDDEIAGGDLDAVEKTLRATEEVLKGLKDPKTGRPVISRVYRTRELYDGPMLINAPDLIPSWWEDGFLLEQSVPGGPAERDVERSRTPVLGGVEFAGSHRMDGVFLMAGGPAQPGLAFEGARIIDVAPTALYLMGLPIPAEMDGRPLLEALDPAFVAGRGTDSPPEPPPVEVAAAPGVAFTDEESQLIGDRLRALGYLD
jgi:predicted AlkP superfamily phosphohydrolase/phosphomutase